MNDAMKVVGHERTLGLVFVGLSLAAKVFPFGGPLSSFLQVAFTGLGLVFLVAGFINARKMRVRTDEEPVCSR
jgi:hypothetical protein